MGQELLDDYRFEFEHGLPMPGFDIPCSKAAVKPKVANANTQYKQYSYSRVDTFKQCPYKFKLRYLDEIKAIPSDDADNALVLGTALHTGIEKGIPAAIGEYFNAFHIITDRPYWKSEAGNWKYVSDHITEQIKLEYLIAKARAMLPQGIHELQIITSDFIGYVDLLVPTGEPNEYDLYDFKYTKDGKRYKESEQLHLYKYFLEQQGKRICSLNYLIIPKIKMIKIGKTEDLTDYRQRVIAELQGVEPYFMEVNFDYRKVVGFLLNIKRIQETKEYTKFETRLCDWCEYQLYCQKGIDYMLTLPANKPSKQTRKKKTLWLYGEPYTGKTTFASQFPNHLFLTTDGNIRELMTYAADETPPAVEIKDVVTVEGRMTKRKLAWEIFCDAVVALETQENPFDTIVLDHLGELYDHCRLFIFDREGIKHETEEGYGKGWDIVRTEFLTTIKRVVNLDYENIILISHEDRTKDITQKSGAKVTAIKPKMRDAFLSNIAGMVDMTARTLAEDGKHTLSFKTSEVIFGGGRLKPRVNEIPLDYSEFLKLYEDSGNDAPTQTERTPRQPKEVDVPAEPKANESPLDTAEETSTGTSDADQQEPPAEKPKSTRARKKRGE